MARPAQCAHVAHEVAVQSTTLLHHAAQRGQNAQPLHLHMRQFLRARSIWKWRWLSVRFT